MKHIKEMVSVLAIFLLAFPLFAQTNEETKEAAAKDILCDAVLTGNETRVFGLVLFNGPITDLNYTCKDGYTPLQYATAGEFFSIAEVLVRLGAKVDPFSFHVAILQDNFDFVQLFIDKGADLCLKLPNRELGLPASRYAESEGMKELLIAAEKNADLEVDEGICYPKEEEH